MTLNNQNKLGKALWAVANELRGAMMADDFRDYMLSFLFWKYLSDNYLKAAKKELGSDYPAEVKNDSENEVVCIPLQMWYNANMDDAFLFEQQMRRKIHYVIEPQYLWDNVVGLARTQSSDLLKTLQDGFKYIENESFESSFKGLFSEINLNSEKLGKSYTERNVLLCKVIKTIANKLAELSVDSDDLGDAYEYLIGQFAAGSGQKAGEFYTPQMVSSILSRIVTLDCQDPKSGQKSKIDKVLDFACGSGSLLLNVRKEMGSNGIGKIYGQEKNITTYNLARMNMLLHGVKDTEFEIHHGDTLVNDWSILSEENPAKKLTFDAIVANPPFSLRWDPKEETAKDFRFNGFGVAPKSAADFAFLLHGLHFLSDSGTMAIILPHGVLFRGGKEEVIRKELIKKDYIDAIIGLPANLFYSTGIPVCIIVLKKCRKNDKILFINASSEEHYEKGKRQNYLRKDDKHDDVKDIIDAYKSRTTISRYSREVSLSEIKENGYNLNITRYVNLSKEEETVDLAAVQAKLVDVERKIIDARNEHNKFLRELGLKEIM
jgi:type I restriction enzyme M protein